MPDLKDREVVATRGYVVRRESNALDHPLTDLGPFPNKDAAIRELTDWLKAARPGYTASIHPVLVHAGVVYYRESGS